eukprot:1232786-Rhodomonas_salina.8
MERLDLSDNAVTSSGSVRYPPTHLQYRVWYCRCACCSSFYAPATPPGTDAATVPTRLLRHVRY